MRFPLIIRCLRPTRQFLQPPGSIAQSSAAQPASSPPLIDPPTIPARPPHRLGAWNTPLTLDEDSAEAFGFAGKNSDSRYDRTFRYARHHFIGPMPVEAFLDTCMDRTNVFKKWPQAPVPSWKDAFASVPESASNEKEIYQPLVSAQISIQPEDGATTEGGPT